MNKTFVKTFGEKNFTVEVPDNTTTLDELESIIESLKYDINKAARKNTMDDDFHTTYFDKVAVYLDVVATLSKPCFEIRDAIEDAYMLYFINQPELGKALWYEHYEEIHKPYTLLKNRCYRLFDLLDNVYRNKFKSNPPNWKE